MDGTSDAPHHRLFLLGRIMRADRRLLRSSRAVEYEFVRRNPKRRGPFGPRKVVDVLLASVLGQIEEIPAWLGAALVAAVIAALGYVGRLVVDEWRSWRIRRAKETASLLSLKALLDAAGAAFAVQAELRDRLRTMLHEHHPEVPDDEGYERYFSSLHCDFSTGEIEIHRLIRGYTVYALRPTNQAISEWLSTDTTHRTPLNAQGDVAHLARMLNKLDAHLRLWHAKYEAWIPEMPEHALVYLADEQRHGVEFPKGIEQALDRVISRRKR